LNVGITLARLGITRPWMLREAAQRKLAQYLSMAWTDYTENGQTPEKQLVAIEAEKEFRNVVLETLEWAHMLNDWIFEQKIPFPDRPTAIDLWLQDAVEDEDMIHSQVAPWWYEQPKPSEVTVRMFREAVLHHDNVRVSIVTNPTLHVLEHPTLPVSHQLMSYGPPPYIGAGYPNREFHLREKEPFVGVGGEMAWPGFLPIQPGWRSIQAEGDLPEPVLRVRTRTVVISRRVARQLTSALTFRKPVLTFVPIHGTSAPALVLPNLLWDVDIEPLFISGTQYAPMSPDAAVKGYCVNDTQKEPLRNLFKRDVQGFMPIPVTGNATRPGNMHEVLPYA
jgi:hypothetical protein